MSGGTTRFAVPDLCNVTALTLVVLFAQLLVIVLWIAGDDRSWLRFALLSFIVQWVALSSAGALCLLRRWLDRFAVVIGAAIAFLVVISITFALGLVADRVLAGFGPDPVDRSRVGSMLAVSGIITGLVLRYFYVQQRLRAKEQSELQARLQALQSRIRPHFLFNSMNIIASLIAVDPETAESVVEDLSELFRASLNEAGNQVPFATELDLCERYARIEKLRLGDRLSLQWEIGELPEGVRIPLLTLQPLMENAIYHGVQPRAEGGTVHMSVRAANGDVVIRITNPLAPAGDRSGGARSGDVRSGDVRSGGEGNRMALENIRSRLQVLYGDRAELKAEAAGDQFVTELRFPQRGGAAEGGQLQ